MAYAFSWIVWAPGVLGEDGAGLLPIRIDRILGGYLNAAAIPQPCRVRNPITVSMIGALISWPVFGTTASSPAALR